MISRGIGSFESLDFTVQFIRQISCVFVPLIGRNLWESDNENLVAYRSLLYTYRGADFSARMLACMSVPIMRDIRR
jgi:hypothetical protein